MSNLFKRTSSNWARYDKYEWKEDKEGTLYITPSPDAKVSLYNPLKDSEQIVLKAVNLGLMCMDKNNTQERLQNAIMDFVTGYGLLGFMTALPTTPDFTQNYNRYIYCLNNPLKFTDVSGELFGIDDAPDGTIALPSALLSKTTSTSTVGFPLESNISLPITFSISR